MNTVFYQRLSVLLSVAAFTVLGGGLSAQADQQLEQTTSTQEAASSTPAPMPGTTATLAGSLTQAQTLPSQMVEPAAEAGSTKVAQIDIDPGQPTRGGSSYIGVAGNIGIDGESAVGDTSFAVISKIGFTNRISARPSVMIEDDPVILIPITYDFSFNPADAFAEPLPIAPYIGGGIGIETSNEADVGFLLTGGVDFPINPQFTATAAVNAMFGNETDVGLVLGVGYNFTGL